MDLSLKLLHFCGQNVMGNRTVFTVVHTIVYVFCGTLCFLEPVLTNGDIESWAAAFEVLVPCFQWSLKLLTLKLYKESFRRAILDRNKFWSIDSCGKQVETRIQNIQNFINRFYNVFVAMAVVTVLLMLIKPLLTIRTMRQLPAQFYAIVDFTKSPYFEIAYIFYTAYCYIILTLNIGFDGVFLGLLSGAGCQLILLKHAFKHVKVDSEEDKMKAREIVPYYIDHHCFILQYIKETRRVYSLFLLCQYMCSTLGVCMPIYLFYVKGFSDMVLILRCCGYSGASVFQIFIYCITSHLLKLEVETIADAFYESDWWKSDATYLNRAAVLVIQRSQTTSKLKAGGMIDVDLQSFVSVLHMSFSFFTLMQSAEAKKHMH